MFLYAFNKKRSFLNLPRYNSQKAYVKQNQKMQNLQKHSVFLTFLIKKTLLKIACPAIEGERIFHANMFFHRQFNDFPCLS